MSLSINLTWNGTLRQVFICLRPPPTSTNMYRAMSGARTIDPPPPPHLISTQRACPPSAPKGAVRGWWVVQYFGRRQTVGLASYSIINLRPLPSQSQSQCQSRHKYFLRVLKNHINPFRLSALGCHNICRLFADKIKRKFLLASLKSLILKILPVVSNTPLQVACDCKSCPKSRL